MQIILVMCSKIENETYLKIQILKFVSRIPSKFNGLTHEGLMGETLRIFKILIKVPYIKTGYLIQN